MGKNRLEAFSDGVLAIIITIMVLELKVPHGVDLANLHLLFWLSLIPFATGWLGENHFAAGPSALYGFVLLMAAIAYWILQELIIASQGEHSPLKRAVGGDWKARLSLALYLIAILVALLWTWVSLALYVVAALLWLVPDRRIERLVHATDI